MKNLIILISLVMLAGLTTAQNYQKLAKTKFKNDSDYIKAEPTVLKCANYILSTPYDKDNANFSAAFIYIFNWMQGTPDFTFKLGKAESKIITKKEPELLLLLMTSMVKYALENRDNAGDQLTVRVNAFRILIAYVQDKNNHVKITKALQKVIAAEENGNLEEFLKDE